MTAATEAQLAEAALMDAADIEHEAAISAIKRLLGIRDKVFQACEQAAFSVYWAELSGQESAQLNLVEFWRLLGKAEAALFERLTEAADAKVTETSRAQDKLIEEAEEAAEIIRLAKVRGEAP